MVPQRMSVVGLHIFDIERRHRMGIKGDRSEFPTREEQEENEKKMTEEKKAEHKFHMEKRTSESRKKEKERR
jgi:hypothetical protein